MDYEKLKEVIAKQIKENGKREITGPVLQAVLMAMVDSLGEVYPHTYTDEEKAQARANIDALSNHNGEITKEKLSLEVQAILNDVANKQNISDATLATIAKTIVGAINEVYKGGLEDASIATSKIEDGAITEPKLDTDLINVITSAVQPAELASAIATALASYVAKADIVDTTGSATDKVMSQHGVTEAIDGVTNKVTELENGINILEIESKETQLGSLSKAISETTYLNVNCSTSYIVGQIVNVIFRSSVDCVITPYAYGSGASIYRTYSNITLIANEDKMVKMSIDEVQGYYGFGGLATKAGTYKVNVSQTITESKALSNIYVKGKMFVTNGNVVYENDVIKSCNIVWADGKSGTLINSNWDDSVLEYATTKVTYDGTTYTYNRQYSELGEVIKETIN